MSKPGSRLIFQEFVFPVSALLAPCALALLAGEVVSPRTAVLLSGAFALLAILPLWLQARGLRRRLGSLAAEFEDMGGATVDLTRRLRQEGNAQDEAYRLAQGFNLLMETLQNTVRAVMSGADHIAGTAGKMAATSTQLAVSSSSQCDAAASTVAAVAQSTASIKHVAERTRETAEISRHASSLSEKGEQVARETAHEMERIAGSMQDSARLIASLSQHSNNISGIVKVIKDIAEQTNLLALNAAIEAARAGEQGRGFAVVADEVRKLAERTASATTEISNMIEAIQTEVTSAVSNLGTRNDQIGQAVKLAEQVAGALAEINAGARQTQERIQEITDAASEQGAASQQIAGHIEHIAHMVEQNNTAVTEAANSARYVDELAAQLRAEVLRFKA